MSLTRRERGAYTRGVGAYIRVEKCISNLGGLYSEELMQGGGPYLRNFTVTSQPIKFAVFTLYNPNKTPSKESF